MEEHLIHVFVIFSSKPNQTFISIVCFPVGCEHRENACGEGVQSHLGSEQVQGDGEEGRQRGRH